MEPVSLRQRVLDGLEDLYCPTRTEELQTYLEGLHDELTPTEVLDQLMREDRRLFEAGDRRSVWLCPGIRPDLHADLNRWTRSDWPLWVRVVHPDSERARVYWLLRQLYRAPVPEVDPEHPYPTPLVKLFVRFAEQLPDDKVEWLRQRFLTDPRLDYKWSRDRFEVWSAIAEDEFEKFADEDRKRCEQVAERLARLDLPTQLFGVPPGRVPPG